MVEKIASHPIASNGMILAGALFNVAALLHKVRAPWLLLVVHSSLLVLG